jgi:uncharacterized protein (DUF2235 family)
MKRIAVFCDGTWNDEKDLTNVKRLRDLLAPTGSDGIEQRQRYIPGVGTKPLERVLGGAVGRGLSANVREGYDYLAAEYEPGDEVYLFGFSRGAYTARSIGGLIATCGLRRDASAITTDWVYERYRERKNRAAPIWELEFIRGKNSRPLTAEETRLLEHSRRIDIHMIGVWDTVGALGVPWTGMPIIGKNNFYFHNPNLSKIYRHAFQALAIDEHRHAYKPTLWTRYVPAVGEAEPANPPEMPELAQCEQRWFAGAHSNVGGGYQDDPLHARPLAWLQACARRLGLTFTAMVAPPVDGADYRKNVNDSYGKFMFGLYRVMRLNQRYYRPIGVRCNRVKGGWSYPINETLDESVFERCRRDAAYPRENLLAWAKAEGIEALANVRGTRKARSV